LVVSGVGALSAGRRGCRVRWRLGANLANRRHEPVAPLRHGLHVGLTGVVVERLTQTRHVDGEIALFHERIRPDLGDQFVLGHQAPGPLGQGHQQLQRLRRDVNRHAALHQAAFGGLEPKRSELVDGARSA
jgi:hypothetical protein